MDTLTHSGGSPIIIEGSPVVSDEPPYIPPSEDMDEDERELTQAFAELLWLAERVGPSYNGESTVDPRDLVRKVISLGWVPEAEMRRAEYERDRAVARSDELEDKLVQTRMSAPEEAADEIDDDELDIITERSASGITVTYSSPKVASPQALAEQVARQNLMRQKNFYAKEFRWRDLS